MNKIGIGLLGLGLLLLAACAKGPSDSKWLRLLGSSAEETAHAVAYGKEGEIYVVGVTRGSVDGTPAKGGNDAFVAKYDTDGKLLWKKALGTPENEEARAVVVDDLGFAYVSGYTGGALDGGSGPKDDQIFLAKFTPEGETSWIKLVGETGPVAEDPAITVNSTKESGEGLALTADGGVVVVGYTMTSFGKVVGPGPDRDGFVAKFNTEGKFVDAKLFATALDDSINAVSHSALDGAIYIAGSTDGTLGADQGQLNPAEKTADAFVARISKDGKESWIRHVGTKGRDIGNSLAVDSAGDVYVGGLASNGVTNKTALGMGDGFVAKISGAGKPLWQTLVGGTSIDTLEGIALGTEGRVYVTGATWSDLKSGEPTGRTDVYVAELSPTDGKQVAALQRAGTDDQAWGRSVAADGEGNVFVVGRAAGTISDQKSAGGFDALLWKLNETDLSPKR
jgi:hypothetical protein